MASFNFRRVIAFSWRHFIFRESLYLRGVIPLLWRHFTSVTSLISHSWRHCTVMSFRLTWQRICVNCYHRHLSLQTDTAVKQTTLSTSCRRPPPHQVNKEIRVLISPRKFDILSFFFCFLACLACMLYLTLHQTIINLHHGC